MTVPIGSYPGGFHVLDFAERFTGDGAEATIEFVGPSINRFTLLNTIFPFWGFFEDEETGACCVCLLGPGYPYPDINNWRVAGVSAPYASECFPSDNCLWPDTFTVTSGTNTCTAVPIPCLESGDIVVDPLICPLIFGNGAAVYPEIAAGAQQLSNECDCHITVNYRRKYNGTWPQFLKPCEQQDDWKLPDIPAGTFISVATENAVNATVIKGSFLEFFPHNSFLLNDIPGSLCEQSGDTIPANDEWKWCGANYDHAPPTSLTVPSEMSPGSLTQTTEFEVTWSGVPLVPWSAIRNMRGCVNSTVWLGFPPESVLFAGYRIEPVSRFAAYHGSSDYINSCRDFYNITYLFTVRTAPVKFDPALYPTPIYDTDYISRGVYNGQIGIWNRIYAEDPIGIFDDGDTEPPVICTNWVPVQNKKQGCCDTGKPDTVYPIRCLDHLFQMEICGPEGTGPCVPPEPEP